MRSSSVKRVRFPFSRVGYSCETRPQIGKVQKVLSQRPLE